MQRAGIRISMSITCISTSSTKSKNFLWSNSFPRARPINRLARLMCHGVKARSQSGCSFSRYSNYPPLEAIVFLAGDATSTAATSLRTYLISWRLSQARFLEGREASSLQYSQANSHPPTPLSCFGARAALASLKTGNEYLLGIAKIPFSS